MDVSVGNLLIAFIAMIMVSTVSPFEVLDQAVKTVQNRDLHEIPPADKTSTQGRIGYGVVAVLGFAILIGCFGEPLLRVPRKPGPRKGARRREGEGENEMSVLLMVFDIPVHRAKALKIHKVREVNTLRALVIVIYVLGVCFIVSGVILVVGLGLTNLERCRAAIYLCLVFYVGGKVIIYVFLVERAHALRASRHHRHQDWIYIIAMLIVLGGFGTIAVFAFIKPHFEVSSIDGKCRIGLPLSITIPLLTYDIAMNLGMTVLFVVLVYPYARRSWSSYLPVWLIRTHRRVRRSLNSKVAQPDPAGAAIDTRGRLERLIWKSLVASVAILISTVVNLAILFKMHGREQSWLCFTLCTIDGQPLDP